MNTVMMTSHTCFRNLLLIIGSLFLISTVVATQGTNEFRQTLPPGFAALVPEGAKLANPSFSRAIVSGFGSATVEFYAEKEVDQGTQHFTVRYHLRLQCETDSSWKAHGSTSKYASYVEQKAEEQRKSFAKFAGTSVSTGITSYPPEMKKYSWGYGVDHRVDNVDIGGNASAPPITTYDSYYFGIAGTSLFEASVNNYLGGKDEVEKWIAKVALKAAQTNITNISD